MSRLEFQKISAAIVWRDTSTDQWRSYKLALGKNKNVFNAKLQGIFEALGVALKKTITKKPYKVTVFFDFQMAIRKIQESKTRVGQTLKAQIVKKAKQLQSRSSKMTI